MAAPVCTLRFCMPQIKLPFSTGCSYGMHASVAALCAQLMAWEPNRSSEHATKRIEENTMHAWMLQRWPELLHELAAALYTQLMARVPNQSSELAAKRIERKKTMHACMRMDEY